jgi:two-component system, NarL family, sensor histidine kinase UhpB
MSLRFRINLLITVLTALFTAVLIHVMVQDARRSIREEMEGANRATMQLLSTVIRDAQLTAKAGQGNVSLLLFLKDLGRVRAHDIRLFDYDDNLLYTSPPSAYKAGRAAPQWFVRLVQPDMPLINLPVVGGNVTVTVDASRSIVDAWDDLKNLMLLILGFVVAVNVLVFVFIGRALKPVSTVLEGLKRMERGEFDARLPRFALPEFDAVSHTFNGMADALAESHAENRRLALIAEQSGDGISIQDMEGCITYWNPAAERMFGWPAAEIVGRSGMLIVPPERHDEVRAHTEILRGRGIVDHVETQRLARDGRHIEVALTKSPLVDPASGAVIGEICSFRDITEVKRAREAEAELAQNRRLTQVIQSRLEEERHGIARELHDELGQCLTAIKTIGAVIANRTEGTQPEIYQNAQTIVSVTERMYDSVHGIIRQLRPSALDHLGLRETLVEAVANWRKLNPGIQCRLDLDGALDALGERINITVYRIVQECLTNIAKHAAATEASVRVSRSGTGRDDRLEVVTCDNGKGLGMRDPRDSVRFGLMGMRERTEALGGTFSVQSEAGQGVTVRVSIPLVGGVSRDGLESAAVQATPQSLP